MKRFILLSAIWLTWLSGTAYAQSSGVIEYEITRKIEGGRMRIITIDGSSGGAPVESSPTVINLIQELKYTPGLGRLSAAEPAMMRQMAAQGQNIQVFRPFEEQSFVDFNSGRMLNYIKSSQMPDSSYFSEVPFAQPSKWEESKKTKQILGFTCKRATCEYRDKPYTVWYTDALGLTFSPVSDMTPPQGFVLAIEGEDMAYEAKKIEAKEIPVAELIPPSGGQKVEAKGIDAARRRFMEAMMKNGQPGGFQVIRNN